MTALVRLILQLKTYRRFYVDDYFLIFACVCLTASTVLGFINVDNLYWEQEIDYSPGLIIELMEQHVDIAAHINTYERLYRSYPVLLWAAIFAVKFAYLAFFRRLVDRIRPFLTYWWVIVGLSVVSFPVCVISVYLPCPKWGLESGK